MNPGKVIFLRVFETHARHPQAGPRAPASIHRPHLPRPLRGAGRRRRTGRPLRPLNKRRLPHGGRNEGSLMLPTWRCRAGISRVWPSTLPTRCRLRLTPRPNRSHAPILPAGSRQGDARSASARPKTLQPDTGGAEIIRRPGGSQSPRLPGRRHPFWLSKPSPVPVGMIERSHKSDFLVVDNPRLSAFTAYVNSGRHQMNASGSERNAAAALRRRTVRA